MKLSSLLEIYYCNSTLPMATTLIWGRLLLIILHRNQLYHGVFKQQPPSDGAAAKLQQPWQFVKFAVRFGCTVI